MAWEDEHQLGSDELDVLDTFAAQCALLLRVLAIETRKPAALGISRAIVPLIVMAETFSWYAVITTNYVGNTMEESTWGLVAMLLIAGLAAGLSAICYAEMASAIPVSGSTYSYAYHTLGELVAMVIAARTLGQAMPRQPASPASAGSTRGDSPFIVARSAVISRCWPNDMWSIQ